MGVFDKIKNALFEVEYVEVDEPSKPEKKKKEKKHEQHENKPIAKKVVLPGKKEEKVEKLEEEELKDDNFEARPKDENIKEEDNKSFKFIDDSEFKTDDYAKSEPEIVKVIDNNELDEQQTRSEYRTTRNNNYSFDSTYSNSNSDAYKGANAEKSNLYSGNKSTSKPYGLDESYKMPTYEYGSYEKKEDKKVFKPSPIISPIYGILDKNYKKEDVVQKKEVRLTSSYSRSNVSVDEVRDKALGSHQESKKTEAKETTFSVDDGEDDDLLVDLTNHDDKPEVKELTMGDALEYFQDLGLEYNVDYVDANNKASQSKPNPKIDELKIEEKKKVEEKRPSISDVLKKEAGVTNNEEKKTVEVEKPIIVKDKTDEEEEKKDDDNLFDLIDSMYEEKGE